MGQIGAGFRSWRPQSQYVSSYGLFAMDHDQPRLPWCPNACTTWDFLGLGQTVGFYQGDDGKDCHVRFVVRKRPDNGFIALNTDKSYMNNVCGFGGLLRFAKGQWIFGKVRQQRHPFWRTICHLEGPNYMLGRKLSKAIKFLLEHDHILREENACAYFLAKQGVQGDSSLVCLTNPPSGLVQLLSNDVARNVYPTVLQYHMALFVFFHSFLELHPKSSFACMPWHSCFHTLFCGSIKLWEDTDRVKNQPAYLKLHILL
ncbi:hypothetical protein VNO78_23463 [Psophocarpus tetragonolobus]|uniref:Uncharacterized protein n=1 Tax=Psophocarpus tetragonolobus TaxID=3891 RepID=A0AAN9S426_PSOTE